MSDIEPLKDRLLTTNRPAEDLRTVMRAMREGWAVPTDVKRAAVLRAMQIVNDPLADMRDVQRSSEFLLAIDKHLLESMKQEDAMQRLDNGQATERIELKPITFERRD